MNIIDDPKKLVAARDQAFRALRARPRLLLAAATLGLIGGIVFAHIVKPIYVVSMTVTAARYTSDTKPVIQSDTLSFLTRPDSGELSDFAFYLRLLTSQTVAKRIYENHPELVIPLFPLEWHKVQWAPPRTLKFTIKSAIYSLVGAKAWSPPDPWRLSMRIAKLVKVKKSGRDPVATVTIRMHDRGLATGLLYALHDETEFVLKATARERSDTKAKYLQSVIETTPTMDLAATIRQSQLRSRMSEALSRSPVPFAAEFISAPDGPTRPSQMLKLISPPLGAFMLTALAAICIILADGLRLRMPKRFAQFTPPIASGGKLKSPPG